jgi:hypothetical protein
MTETTPPPENDLTSEFRTLGNNLKSILKSIWESEETQKLKREVQEGLTELGRVTNETAEEFVQGETGQRLKSEAEDLQQRIRSGEVETKARRELLKVLRVVNAELEKARSDWSPDEVETPDEPPKTEK